MQTLEIENKTDASAIIAFYFTGEDYYDFDHFIQKDSLALELESGEQKIYDFGIGTWEHDHDIDSLASRITSIKIQTSLSTQIFIDSFQVSTFLKNRIVDDQYRARILIEIAE